MAALHDLAARQMDGAAFFLLDPHGFTLSWNPGVGKLLGYSESEWIGKPGAIIFTPEDRERGEVDKEMAQAKANGSAADLRWHLRKDGSRIFADGILQALRAADGSLVGFAKIFTDATDRQVAHEAVQHILESIGDAFFAIDASYRCTYANRRVAEWFGCSREQLIGSDCRNALPDFICVLEDVMSGRRLARREIQIRQRWLDVSAYPEAGGGVSCYARDITAGKKASERTRQLTDALDLTQVSIRGADGTIRFWSKGCERLYGWTAAEAVGRRSWDLLQTQFPEPLERIEAHLREHGSWHGELRHTCRNGEPLTVAADWVAERGVGGEIQAVIATHTDITAQKTAQAALTKANHELSSYSHVVSHDLQAPVRMVQSYAELLARRYGGNLDDTGREFLGYILDGARRMHILVRTLLDYAQTGDEAVDKHRVASAVALENCLRTLAPDIAQTGAQVTSSELPLVCANLMDLERVLQNLLSNAIKYRTPGVVPRIEIDSVRQERFWQIRVRDNGVGIPPEHHEQVFEPLRRLHGPEIPGTGLGLSSCKRIVERLGGRIWVESEPGVGSTFSFTLPAA